ncbi:hypothetical protein M514_07723 [Trichuris suis]|uniref:Endonuclease/exonuclease/phosphatase domain-containing protein n=1 Tax=Trichuris suis TaxID=68888 RepID=A0A085MT41_9BILA|nr:hypothetical protein M514_07723 [Trichuris suis]
MLSIRTQGKPFNVKVTQIYAPTADGHEFEVNQLYADLQRLLEKTPRKDVTLILGDWNDELGNQKIAVITVHGQIVQYKTSTTKRSTRQMVQGKNVHETNGPRRKCPLDKSSTGFQIQLMLLLLGFN